MIESIACMMRTPTPTGLDEGITQVKKAATRFAESEMTVSSEDAGAEAVRSLSLVAPKPVPPVFPRITALGGGHGLAAVLQGLMNHKLQFDIAENGGSLQLAAVVTVADDGGSSGALRQTLNIQALGDIRNCLLALSNGDPMLQDLFNFRFSAGLDRHSLGNLILAALTLLEKDFDSAVERAGKLLGVQGRVIPATEENVELLAEFDDGGMIKGESRITADERCIRRLSLLPADVPASPSALAAITASDLVVIGPGSIYTSLIPILLLSEVVQAIVESGAHVVLVMNLMTEVNETLGYSAADILRVIREHTPNLPIHTILVNEDTLPRATLQRYATKGAVPISVNPLLLETMGSATVSTRLLARGRKIRHDPMKLAQALLPLIKKMRTESMGGDESQARSLA